MCPIRSCIVGCYTTEDYFLAKEGVILLLDLLSVSSQAEVLYSLCPCAAQSNTLLYVLLQSSPRCVHCIILATLLELCDNPNTLSHILDWRNDGGQTAPGLLLQLWREEEEELRVSRNQHGGIAGQSGDKS